MFYYLRRAWPLIKEKSGRCNFYRDFYRAILDTVLSISIMPACCETLQQANKAGVAQLVERNLAKVEVESSRLFSRSKVC
jgi:hypothetical protein